MKSGAENEQAVDNFNFRTEFFDRPACLHAKKIPVSWNRRILETLLIFELSLWLWKSMNEHLRKSVNVAQKKRSSV